MSRLDEAARRVSADPATADTEDQELDEGYEAESTDPGYGSDSGDELEEGEERSAENVRGELLRKMEKSQKEMMGKLDKLQAENTTLRDQLTTPVKPDSQAPKTFDDMSVNELIQMQANIPEEQQAAFNIYLMDRKVDERVDERLGKFETTTTFNQEEDKFNQQAYDRWPELRQKGSEFYGIADRILSEMGPKADKNPRAVLDAANEAGLALGVAPKSGYQRDTRRSPGNVAPGRSTKGTQAPDLEASEEDQAIAGRLANAMPGKKFSKAQLKRIAKNGKMYKASINSHLRG